MFVVCHSLRVVLNMEEIVNLDFNKQQRKAGCPGVGFWGALSLPVSGLLLQLNSSTNFFIYCIFDNIFKDILISQLPRRISSKYLSRTQSRSAMEMQTMRDNAN